MKKLKYLIFLLTFLFTTNVNAQTYQLSFNTLRSTSQNLDNSFQCNNNLCVVYGAEFLNIPFSFEWGTSGSPTCSSTAVVSGKIHTDNVNFGINNDDYSYNKVYLIDNNVESNCSFQVGDSTTDFVCTSSSLSSNFKIGFTLNPTFGGATTLNTLIYRSIDINCDTSTGQIIENQNTNTQNIINNNTSNTNQIIQNNEQNTQDIIDNQNQNTQDVIDNQNNTFGNFCYTNLFDKNNYSSFNKTYLDNTYWRYSNSSDPITIRFPVEPNTSYQIISDESVSFTRIATTSSDSIPTLSNSISISNYVSLQNQTKLSYNYVTSSNSKYMLLQFPTSNFNYIIPKLLIYKGDKVVPYVPFGEQNCINKLDEQTSAINDVNSTLNDTSQPNTNQDVSDMNDMVASDTPISDLITMPLTLITAYINGVNATCSSVNLGNLYGTDLILPCINLEQRLGSNLWYIIDAFFSLFMCYNIGMLFVSAFDGLTSLRDDFEGLYQPRHADTGYQPKHGG